MKKLIAFALLGVAAKIFLDSEAGKDLKKQLRTWLDDAKGQWGDAVETVKATVNQETPKMNS